MLKIIVLVTLMSGGSVRIEHTLHAGMRGEDQPWMVMNGVLSCEEMARTLFRYTKDWYAYPPIKSVVYHCNRST